MPQADMLIDSAGNLFGATLNGGPNGGGVIFELSPQTGGGFSFSLPYAFSGSDGSSPMQSLVMDAFGNIFGTTQYGGANGDGTVFKLTPNFGSWTFDSLYSFASTHDGTFGRDVILDRHGDLFGSTESGGNRNQCRGAFGCGIVYTLTPTPLGTWKETILSAFTGGAGGEDATSMFFGPNGKIYGVFHDAGQYNAGSIFELSPQR